MLASVEKLDVQPHCVMALRLFEETAALRDFDPAYARYGSIAPQTIRAGSRSMSAVSPKADKILNFGAAAAIGWAQKALR